MEQSPQNPGAPAQASTMQGSPLPENTAQSNASQGYTAQGSIAESIAVEATAAPATTALQSPEHDPALAGHRLRCCCRGGSTRPRRTQAHGPLLAYLPPGCGSPWSVYRRDTSNVAIPDVHDRA